MKAVFCAPTNFFALACLRQFVRLACLAASSLPAPAPGAAPGGGDEAAAAAASPALSGPAKAIAKLAAKEQITRQAAAAESKERMANTLEAWLRIGVYRAIRRPAAAILLSIAAVGKRSN
jgi:hypothetical protein